MSFILSRQALSEYNQTVKITAATLPKFRHLSRYVQPYRKQMFVAMVALTLGSLIVLALPWALRILIDSIFISKDLAQLRRLSFGLIVLFAFHSMMVWVQNYLFTFVANRTIADLRMDVYSHLLELPLHFFNDRHLGEIISRVTSDISVIQLALTQTPAAVLRQLIVFFGGLMVILWLDWYLVFIIFLLAPLVFIVAKYLGRNLQSLATDVQDTSARLTTTLEETLAGIREVKSFSRENDEQQRFLQRTEIRFDVLMRQAKARAFLIASISFLGFAGISLLLWYGGLRVIEGRITPGDMIAIIVYLGVVVSPIGEFAGQYSNIQASLGAVQRVYEMMHLVPEPLDNVADKRLPPVIGRVHFKNVFFHYIETKPVLKNINLVVEPGEVIALVGPSGAGKTTLVNLIARFYDLSVGCIEIDGYDISRVQLAGLRKQIGLIQQETFLFGRTVRENVAYGYSSASDEEIEAVARAAYAHEFIAALPAGYDTLVGGRGNKLSAGQRQRIAIARMLLKDPRILLLDEATAALDPETERCVSVALNRLMRGRTTFIITHRLESVKNADRIIVLKEGVIEEQGTFDELLASEGAFYRLFTSQEAG